MDYINWKDTLKKHVIKVLEEADRGNPDWGKEILEYHDRATREDIIWILNDLAKEGKYIDAILAIAEVYVNDPNPEEGYQDLNKKVKEGEEIRSIFSVRGDLAWLLQTLVITLRTDLYGRILDMVEKLAVDPIFYVRQQVAVPLSAFTANIKAVKNRDGTPFNFSDVDRKRAFDLAFSMLDQNQELPRVLENLVSVFDRLRFITEAQAKHELITFFYDSSSSLRPDYLTNNAAPLAIFFAEFRKVADKDFNNQWFQDFLIQLIKDADKASPRLRGTLIWNIWRTIKDQGDTYHQLKKYIDYFFEGQFESEPVGQLEFLVQEVFQVSPQDGVVLLKKVLNYIGEGLRKAKEPRKVWLLSVLDTLRLIAKNNPKDLLEVLPEIEKLIQVGAYVGEIPGIFSLYKDFPEEKKLEEISKKMYKGIRNQQPELPEL
jgi:hypothetical protein